MSGNKGARTYTRRDCAVFRKTDEAFGGLSNMAPGYPVRVNGVRVMTIEALYQASRFPHLPDVQRLIIDQHSPMTAKMVSKPHRKDSRADWDKVRITVMRWCLRLKLSQHWSKFSQLLLSTGDRAIVEDSKKDDFWGAVPSDGETLVGLNVLGRLLMELREEIKKGAELRRVEAPAIANFLLFGEPLQVVDFRTDKTASAAVTRYAIDESIDDLALPLFADRSNIDRASKPIAEIESPPSHRRGIIEGLPKYPEYKDSRLPWCPAVPAHWKTIPNRAMLRKRKVLVGKDHVKFQLLSLTKSGVIVRDVSTGKGKFSSDMGTSQEVRPGDFIFCLFDVPETPRTVGLSRHHGMITSAYTLLEAHNLSPVGAQYLEQFYIAMDDRKLLSPLYSGLRNTIPPSRFLGAKSPCPPSEEQESIVRFLAHANRRIDGFIRAKRKLIGLLNEQKQAIIHRAVTRGLDPHAPLKRSGIPWLGDIPQHWEVSRVCRVFRQVTRFIATGDEPKMSMSRHRGLIRSSELSNRAAQAATSIRFSVCVPGDLVLNKYQAHNGLFGAAIEKGLITSNYSVFEPLGNARAAYFALLFASPLYRGEFRMRCQGVGDGMMPLYSSAFLKTPVAIPPAEEQGAIFAHIEKATSALSETIARTEREIALMQEYRTRLTADVVTGKLDVRPAATHLPALTSDSTPEDATEAVEETEPEEVEA